jgi:hypothetical protein
MRNGAIGALGIMVVTAVLSACSSTGTQVRPRGPWSPELAQFFDDAADFIEDPGDLQGAWSADYARELQGRVDEADLICRAEVRTVNEDISVDGHRRKHLLMQVTSVLYGEAPEDNRLHISVGEGSSGFDTIDRSERRLISNHFIAFIRWYEDDDGSVRAHWHLSPATRPLVAMVRRAITERQEAAPAEGEDR